MTFQPWHVFAASAVLIFTAGIVWLLVVTLRGWRSAGSPEPRD